MKGKMKWELQDVDGTILDSGCEEVEVTTTGVNAVLEVTFKEPIIATEGQALHIGYVYEDTDD